MYTAVLDNRILNWELFGEIKQLKINALENLGYILVNEDLIARCRAKEREAQRVIYEKLSGKMFGICRRYIRNQEDALEVVNSGFLKVFQGIDKFKAKGSFEGWVSKIIVNTAIDKIRSSKSYSDQIILDEEFESKYDSPINTDDYNDIDTEILYEIIDKLPAISKTVFNLYAIEGYTHKEIGKKLNISVGTSKWHVSTARQKLKGMLIKAKNNLEIVDER